jgi:hypothetical protein
MRLQSALVAARGNPVQTRRRLRFENLEARHLLHGAIELPPGVAGEGESGPMPDFTLTDVNPASPRKDQGVSPRDYLRQVSAWYFGHAT